jgi:hypothetical protein
MIHGHNRLRVPVGTVSAPFSVFIAGQNGFADTVTLTLSGLPTGGTSQPASPFTVAAGQSQSVAISVPASAALGSFAVQVEATSGSLSHTAQLGLTLMLIKTFDNGAGLLYLEKDTFTEMTRVGLQKSWGGSIVEVGLNGTDYVNNDDPGRQMQTSLWDANTPTTHKLGIQSGRSGRPFLRWQSAADVHSAA